MTHLTFFPVDPSEAEPPEEYDDGGCPCAKPDSAYQLEINEGQVSLVHATCGKPPPASWGDWEDLVYMNAIPVRLAWVPECDGSMWHGDQRCDCGVSVELTPVPET